MSQNKERPKNKEITYGQIKENAEIKTFIQSGNEVLGILGYTDHSRVHAVKVAETAGKIRIT